MSTSLPVQLRVYMPSLLCSLLTFGLFISIFLNIQLPINLFPSSYTPLHLPPSLSLYSIHPFLVILGMHQHRLPISSRRTQSGRGAVGSPSLRDHPRELGEWDTPLLSSI